MSHHTAEANQPHLRVMLPSSLSVFLAAAAFNAYWLALISNGEPRPWAEDYGIYYRAFLAGQQGNSAYLPYNIGGSFVYHPAALSLVSLLALFGLVGQVPASLAWVAINAAAYGAALLLCLDVLRPDQRFTWRTDWPLAVLALSFGPFLEAAQIGQVNGLVLLALIGAFWLAERDRPWWAGAALAAAVVLKTSPLLFVAYFLLMRRWRVLMGAGAALAAFSLIGYVQFGPGAYADFWAVSARISDEPHLSFYNHSLQVLALRTLDGLPVSGAVWGQRLIVGGLMALALGLGLLRPPIEARERLRLYALLMALMTLASPLVWYHHSMFLMPLALTLLLPFRCESWIVLAALGLMQAERLFGFALGSPPASGLLVVMAQLALIGLALMGVIKVWQR